MMFRELANFGLKRTATQALGFYLAYLLLIMILGGIAGLALGLIFGGAESVEFDRGLGIGAAVGGLVCAYLAFAILKDKHAPKSFLSVVLVVASLALGLLGGGLFGLIIPSYLTTRDPAA